MGIIIFILGLMIGSFLNVCIYRLPRRESIAFPPSHCTSCSTQLKPWDLIPVVSFLLYRGSCRYCGERISVQYPLVESGNAILYISLYLKYGLTVETVMYCILASLLLTIAMIDLFTQEIPDELNIFGMLIGITFIILTFNVNNLISSCIGLFVGGGFFLLIAVASRGAMGGGDIKLMGVLGLWFGWKLILLNGFLSFIIGAAVSLLLIGFRKRGMKDFIPFGPFIAVAAWITLFFGFDLLSWYFSLL